MIWGILLIIIGLAAMKYLRADFIAKYDTSKFSSRFFKPWQGIVTGIVIILIGIAQLFNQQ